VDWIRILLSRCSAFFSRRTLDKDLDEELHTHIDLSIEENVRRGLSRDKARTAALLEFGGVTQTRERYREQRGVPWIEALGQDVRYALRQFRNSPGFAATVVITLALGIGANTAVFSLVHSILERSLPVSDPGRLYRVGDGGTCCYFDGFENDNGDYDLFPYDLYLQLRKNTPEFEQLAAMQAGGSSLSVRAGSAPAKPLRSEYVSGNYFATLGVGAYAGHPLIDSDDKTGAAPVIVLSYATWQSDFAGDPNIVGSTVYVQTHPFTVAGIAPTGFFGDRVIERPPDMWVPLANEPTIEGPGSSLWSQGEEDTAWLYLLGRAGPGTNVATVQAKLSGELRQWMSVHSAFTGHGKTPQIGRQHVVLVPGGGGIQRLQQRTGKGLRLLMILSSVVLLIACANIANLLLAHGTARRAELAVRMALGAGRRRLIRQIITQSVLLSLIGGAAGIAVAYGLSHMILALAFPESRHMPIHANPSLPVLGFTFLVSLVTGVLFGAAPAWLSSQAKPAEALRGVNRAAGDRSSLPQKALVVVQIAMSAVLLAGAFLMARSLANLEHQNFGIVTTNRYILSFDPKGAGYTVERVPALYRQIEERLSALPSVQSVSLARFTPLGGHIWATHVALQDLAASERCDTCFSSWIRVSNRFLDSLGVPVVRGRGFSAQDTQSSQPVVLVNQAFVRQFFPKQDPIGKHFGVDEQSAGAFEIVGVFADFKMTDARGEATPIFLRPLAQQFTGFVQPEQISEETSSMFVGSVIVQFAHPRQDAETLIRRTMASIDPNLTVFSFTPYDAQVAGNFNQDRLIARLTSLFGLLALVLASVGLYGVMSYFVARRTSEIGIRMAMGATRPSVIRMVLGGALGQIAAGLGLGIPIAMFAGHLMASLLYGVKTYDPFAFIGATLVLGLCATLAGYLPARRAASVDPMRALRAE